MKIFREKVFETNSSSTHSLVLTNIDDASYYPPGSKIAIVWADTDEDTCYVTLREKVSYLVSHIARKYKYNVYKYEDLLEEVRNDYEFKELEAFLRRLKDGYEIVFPEKIDDLDDFLSINHQLIENDLEAVLDDLLTPESLEDKIGKVLSPNQKIELGRD